MVIELLILLCIGAASGLLAGMFGIGGGALIVPALIFTLAHFDFDSYWLTHIAIASSLATIIGTSLSSTRSHNKNNNVDWQILKRMVLGCVIGTLLGSYLTIYIPELWLKWLFTLFLIYTGIKFIFETKQVTDQEKDKKYFHIFIYTIVGLIIGIFAALVGVGGGILVIPFLNKCGVNMRKSIGTSAAFTLPVATAGTIGYIISGWNINDLPKYSFGFVYVPAVLTIMLASIPMAKVGVLLTQKIALTKLVKFFGLFLLLIALKLMVS